MPKLKNHSIAKTRRSWKLPICDNFFRTKQYHKFVPQKIAWRMNTKKDIFQKHDHQNPNPRTPMNNYHSHNALTNKKSSAAYFKDDKTEEAFNSQDQKLVETTNLWQLFSDKTIPQSKSASATIANPEYISET